MRIEHGSLFAVSCLNWLSVFHKLGTLSQWHAVPERFTLCLAKQLPVLQRFAIRTSSN